MSVSYDAPLADYEREAEELLAGLTRGDRDAAWRFKWAHPRFVGRSVREVDPARLGLPDAQLVVAREYGFEVWERLAEFTISVQREGETRRFEAAAEAIVTGDLTGLRAMLREWPQLATMRSTRRHHATLLHYVAANGVEGARQKTPANVVEIARLLLESGAQPNALAAMYDQECTTMSMLVSSTPPSEAGLQAVLAETLLEYGATLDGSGTAWQSAVMTALVFGFGETAEKLSRHGGSVQLLPIAAGLGRLADVARLLPVVDDASRHAALALAAQHGRADVVRLLLDAGEDPNRYNPDGLHAHSTPLHQAVWADHADVVRLLVERGARLDMRDQLYDGTPLAWALHGQREKIASYLRERAAPA